MNTIKLSPRLASHAPNVSMIILIDGIIIWDENIDIGIKSTRVSIIPSKHSNDIRRCSFWYINAMVVEKNESWIRRVMDRLLNIELRFSYLLLTYKVNAVKAFNSSVYTIGDYWHPKSEFLYKL
jgi:hypothetical protein